MALSETQLTYFDGSWADGNTPILGAADHSMWHGNMVFDGARFFEGVMPDLAHHCARIIRSAAAMGMTAPVDGDTIEGLIREGVSMLDGSQALYLRPMIWSTGSLASILETDPETVRFAICLEAIAMPEPADMPLTVSPYRRPHPDTALTEAKAACLYPNNARIIAEARARGFKNALSMDLEGHVAETASTNVFMVKDGVVMTPKPNGTFLNGITRQRVISLLRADGFQVIEGSFTPEDFAKADEMFLTGNASKVMPVTALDGRRFEQSPIAMRARELYWDFAHTQYEKVAL